MILWGNNDTICRTSWHPLVAQKIEQIEIPEIWAYTRHQHRIYLNSLCFSPFETLFWMNLFSFYYTSIRSLTLRVPFWHVFSISAALSLLPTHTLSFSLFGGDWGSAFLGFVTFLIRILGVVIILWLMGHTRL